MYASGNWGERSEPHTCGLNENLSIYLLGRAQRAPHLWRKRKFVYIYICYVRIPYIYIHPAPFVRDAIFPHCMFVHVTTVAQETRLTGQKG